MQRAIIAGLIIPTPEVSDVKDDEFYIRNYPADYKMPRQMIHMQRNNKYKFITFDYIEFTMCLKF